jgi:hypothetical protein
MKADKKYDSRGLEGARRTTAMPIDESLPGAISPRPAVIVPPNPEVIATPTRRRFTVADKLRILKLADACPAGGQPGGAAARRRTLLVAPHDVAPPTHGGRAFGLDAPEARPKSLGSASAAGRECDPPQGERPAVHAAETGRAHHRRAKKSHRSWASRWRRPREAGALDGRHTVTVHGDRQ